MALCALALLTGCACGSKEPAVTIISPLEEKTTRPARVDLAPGETFELRLAGNATTGYAWQCVAEPDDCLNIIRSEYVTAPEKKGLCGAPGEYVWVFQAVKPGAAALKFQYFRPWEKFNPATDAQREYSVTVKPAPVSAR